MYAVWTYPYFVEKERQIDYFAALRKITRFDCKNVIIRWF